MQQKAIKGEILSQRKTSILSKAMLVAGCAFILMFIFSLSLYKILDKTISYDSNDGEAILTTLYGISIALIIVTLIMSIFTMKSIDRIKLTTIILMIAFYGIGNGISFGVLFYAINLTDSTVSMIDVMTCFLLTGIIFAVAGLIGTTFSEKLTMTVGKFLMFATIGFIFAYFILMLMSLFTSNIFGSDKLNLVIWAVWGFLIILYIMYDFSVIKKSQQYIQMTDESTQKKYVFMFGFMLFINLIQLLWLLLRLFIALKR